MFKLIDILSVLNFLIIFVKWLIVEIIRFLVLLVLVINLWKYLFDKFCCLNLFDKDFKYLLMSEFVVIIVFIGVFNWWVMLEINEVKEVIFLILIKWFCVLFNCISIFLSFCFCLLILFIVIKELNKIIIKYIDMMIVRFLNVCVFVVFNCFVCVSFVILSFLVFVLVCVNVLVKLIFVWCFKIFVLICV